MKKLAYSLFIAFFGIFLFSAQASGFTLSNGVFCVNDTFDLGFDFQAALDSVTSTDYEIRLIQGTYNIADTSTGHFAVEIDHSLTISGGWNGDCTAQTPDPQLTILQGGAAQDDQGGVLSVRVSDNEASAVVSISNLTFQNGNSTFDGGGFYFEHTRTGPAASATLNLAHVIAESNSSDIYGSGIAVYDYASIGLTVNITDCIVQNNTVPDGSEGGPAGIYIDYLEAGADIDVAISNCRIINNTAEIGGGGLFIDTGSGNATLVNNVIAGNSVSDDNGGGLSLLNTAGGGITLTNNTITGNSSTGTFVDSRDGGGIYAEFEDQASVVNIYNNILYGNAAPGDGDDLYILNRDDVNTLYSTVRLYNNDLNLTQPAGFYIEAQTSFSNGNNLDNIDPLFADAASHDYHLTAVSPVIFKGNNSAPAAPETDFDGSPRPVSCAIDMGAYEYQIIPGDVNNDGTVDLQDALRAIQVLTGITPAAAIYKISDTNCDGYIGVEDVLFILQKISGLDR